MDYSSRIILVSLVGGGIGFGIGHFFSNHLVWIFVCIAFALAADSAIRTIKNVEAQPGPIKRQLPMTKKDKPISSKPPKIRF